MTQPSSSSGLRQVALKQLSNPLKLRFVLCITTIVVWQALFFGPLGEQVSTTTARIALERKRAATAREVERLKKSLVPLRELVGSTADVHELMRHVMARIRSSPLRLADLKPEKPKELGSFEAIGLQLSLEGTYTDIDQFLGWAETSKRLMRIDAIRLTPNSRQPGRLSASITLLALADKGTPVVKTKAESGKTR